MTEKEKLMYKILGNISAIEAPIIFKGALKSAKKRIDSYNHSVLFLTESLTLNMPIINSRV